jgi:PAS domain S-box-containing protein
MVPNAFKYERFFELSPDLFCIAGYDGYFKKINPAVAKTLGYSMEELYARPINDFVHPDDQDITARVRTELTKSKPLYFFENRYKTKTGDTVWLSWTSLPVDSDQLVFAIAKNITHKKRLERERNVLVANLTKANKDIVRVSHSTSHDLRSSVNNLVALFDLMDLSKIGDKETVELIEVLRYAGEKIKNTLNSRTDLLEQDTYSQIMVEETDLQECLDQVLSSVSILTETFHATINADFSAVPRIRFNDAYLKSVLLNLITNSIKYARPDRAPVISIRTASKGGWHKLIVSDNGLGLDVTRMDELSTLDPLTQPSDKKGIGLYLDYSHVTAVGGKISVESKINEGTTFTMSFKSTQ